MKKSKSPASGNPSALWSPIPSRSLGENRPGTIEGIEKYLRLRFDQGHRPDLRETVGICLWPDTLRVLSEEPLRIFDVDGIGEVRARRIMEPGKSNEACKTSWCFSKATA